MDHGGAEPEEHDSEMVRKIIQRRSRLELSLQPVYRIVHLDRPRKRSLPGEPGIKGDGSPKAPHDRMGHFRHYRNGKVVWVRSPKVHGGSPTAPWIEVRK